MTPRHQEIADQIINSILDSYSRTVPESMPGNIVLAKYESQLDYETLRPEDKPATFEDHTEMIGHIASTLTHLLPKNVKVTTPVINASQYLRWLAANGKTNDAATRAEFISNPNT